MRPIDADALLKEIDRIHKEHYANSSYQFIHDFFLAMFRKIRKQPTIDAVPVIRCKDCKHMAVVGVGFCWCKEWERMQRMGGDGFCCYGERRSE